MHINSGELGLDWTIYDQSKNEDYGKWHSMDSIFFFDCSELVTSLEEFKDGDEKTILGKKCKSIIIKAFEPLGKETIIQKFYFSGDEYILPNTYENYKDGYIDKIYGKSNSHFLRRELELKYIYLNFEAVSIEQKEINPEIFIIPDNIEMVKM